MPIKFRCQHCRQFLGISRAKAEQIVDCPTCGRSIRVPGLDGKVAPVPRKPKLDLQDAALVAALEQLADIGEEDDGSRLVLAGADTPQDESDPGLDDALAPVPVAEPTRHPAPAPLPAPVPIDPPPMPRAVRTGSDPSTAAASLSELATAAPSAGRARGDRLLGPIAWVGLLAALLVAVGAGYLLGRWTAPVSAAAPAVANGEPAPPAVETLPPELREAITGRIKYKTANGDRPDEGACVIALPAERTGTIRLSVVGLRPGDVPEDWRVARASLRALGGDASIVDKEGNYRIALPDSGHYHLVVLSRYQGRDPDAALPADVENALARYFEAPRQLVGQRRFEFANEVRWTGAGSVEWGHTFPTEES